MFCDGKAKTQQLNFKEVLAFLSSTPLRQKNHFTNVGLDPTDDGLNCGGE